MVLLTTFSLMASAQNFHTRKLQEEDLDFLLLTGKSVAENRINTFLFGAELQVLPGKYKQSPFENIRPKKGSNQGITGLHAVVLNNTAKIFSVAINGEYTSASLNEFSKIYNFDASTGKVIRFRDLLTDAGYLAVRTHLISDRKKRITDYLKTLKDVKGENKEAYTAYSECLKDMDNDDLNRDDLKFQKDGLLLTKKSCSGQHYFQALQDHADMYANKLSVKFLGPYLNDYGKCLLAPEKTACTLPSSIQTTLHEGVYNGKINNQYAITLVIDNIYKDRIYASYFYDRVGKAIHLRCTMEKGILKMTEEDEGNKVTGVFQLKVQSDGHLSGTWNNDKNNSQVELK